MRLLPLVAGAAALAAPALAQDGTVVTGEVLVDKVVSYLIALTTAMVPVIGTIVTLYLRKKWNVEIDTGLRDGFQSALTNAAGTLIQRLGAKAATMARLDERDPDVADAIRMVQSGSADAIDRFVITPEDIAKRLEAKLGLLTGVTDADGVPLGSVVPSIPISKPV